MQEFLHRTRIEQVPEFLASHYGGRLISPRLSSKLSYTHMEGSNSHEDNLTEAEHLAPKRQ